MLFQKLLIIFQTYLITLILLKITKHRLKVISQVKTTKKIIIFFLYLIKEYTLIFENSLQIAAGKKILFFILNLEN